MPNYFYFYLGLNVSVRSRISELKDIREGDINIFVAHVIAMGLTKKSNMEKYTGPRVMSVKPHSLETLLFNYIFNSVQLM